MKTSIPESLTGFFAPSGPPTTVPTPADLPPLDEIDVDDGAEPSAEAGIHAITRATDVWFERRANALEARAAADAENWAKAGLPLSDVRREEPLDVETVLANHSRQIYQAWAQRVRTKMEDAIARGTRSVGDHVGQLGTLIGRLDILVEDLKSKEEKIEILRRESERDKHPIQFRRMVSPWLFWPMAVLLIAVEFAANFPVFKLMLPMEASLAQVAADAAQNINERSWGAGIVLFARSLVYHVEALVVALVVVAGLVLLGKKIGGSIRPLVAVSAAEHPSWGLTIRAYRREHWTVVAMCLLGLGAALLFLFGARASIASTADSRVQRDSVQVAMLNERMDLATAQDDRNMIGVLSQQLDEKRDVEERHRDDAAYARTVQSNNGAIMLLNVTLILIAAVMGFSFAADNLADRRGEHPDLVVLRQRCGAIRREISASIEEARLVLARSASGDGAVRHLTNARPFDSWEAKVKRLGAVVPHFRAENARLRGMDPRNIRAFDVDIPLGLEPMNGRSGFHVPPELDTWARERELFERRLAGHTVSQSGGTSE